MNTTRHSPKRDAILECLRSTTCHPSAEWVYAQLKPRIPDLSLATVYRNLEAMQGRGEVSAGLLENGERLYAAAEPHAHKHYMICKGCNAMVDLPACPLHALEEEIAGAAGFTVTDHVIQLYGYCKDCRKDGKGKDEL